MGRPPNPSPTAWPAGTRPSALGTSGSWVAPFLQRRRWVCSGQGVGGTPLASLLWPRCARLPRTPDHNPPGALLHLTPPPLVVMCSSVHPEFDGWGGKPPGSSECFSVGGCTTVWYRSLCAFGCLGVIGWYVLSTRFYHSVFPQQHGQHI